MASSDDEGIEQIEDFNLHSYFTQLLDEIEAIIDSTDELPQKSTELSAVLSNVSVPYINRRPYNEFLAVLESLRKKKKLDKFLEVLLRSRIKNKKMLNIIKEAFLSELNILSKNKTETISLLMFKFIIANFIYTIDEKVLKKLIHFLNEKTAVNTSYVTSIIEMIEKNKNIYTIFICGITLSIQQDKLSNENKEKLSEILSSFIVQKVLDDDEREKNIIIERMLCQFLPNIVDKNLYEDIFPKCQSLILRSSQNGIFLHTLFTTINKLNHSFYYKDELIDSLFETFKDFFFPSNSENDLCFGSFSQIVKNCKDKKKLYNKLLETEFDTDKNNYYNYVICYIVDILEDKNQKVNKLFTKEEIIKGVIYILKNFEKCYMQEYNDKYEHLFEKLTNSLITSEIDAEASIEDDLKSSLSEAIVDLISNNEYSNYHCYIYSIASLLIYKYNIALNDNSSLSDQVSGLIKDTSKEINPTTIRNLIPLVSLGINIFGVEDNQDIIEILTLISESKFVLENFNTLSNINAFFLYIITKQLIVYEKIKDTSSDFAYKVLKILSYVMFRVTKSTSELILFDECIKYIISSSEEVSYKLLDFIFMFVLNNSYKISFERIAVFIQKFADTYITKLDEKKFIKMLILVHIPNMNYDSNINNKRPHNKNIFLEKFYKNHKEQLISQIESHIESISQYVLSNLGLFNKNNIPIVNSCYKICKKIFEETKVSEVLIKKSFGKLDLNKFVYIDNIISFYEKQQDYIGYYDLENLVKLLKENEANYDNTYTFQVKKQEEEVKEEKPQQHNNKNKNKKNNNNNKSKNNNNNKKQNTKQEEPKNKEIKQQENKSYLISYCYNLSYNLVFYLNRLKPIVDLLLNANYHNTKANIKYVIEKLWPLLDCKFSHDIVSKILYSYFKANKLTNQFCFEFTNLMYLQSHDDKKDNSALFNEINEKYPALISKFNSKLNTVLSNTDNAQNVEYISKLFNHFDFVIIKILFYIVLNTNIGIDDTVLSVENLILILKNSTSLNYDDISILLISVLKSNYTGDNLVNLLRLYFQHATEQNFLLLCNGLLEYEYISKYSFLKVVNELDMKAIRKYQNLQYKIYVILFEENEPLAELALKIWNRYNMNIDEDYINSYEFKLAMTDHKERDCVIRSICAFPHLIPSVTLKVLDILEKFYEEEVVESKEIINRSDISDESKHQLEVENYLHKRVVLLDYINESIELLKSSDKKSLLDFLMTVSDKEYIDDIFEKINQTIFNLINSIPEKEVVENIMLSVEQNIVEMIKKDTDEINYTNLKIILMMLNSLLVRTLHDSKFNQKKETLFDPLLSLARKIKRKDILYLLFKNFEYISSDIQNKSQKVFTEILNKIKGLNGELVNFGDIYALSGLIKCFGISSYKTNKIDEIILKNMEKKSPLENKQNSMYMINIFFETMKKLYEPYFVELFDKICELIADRENSIRETALLCFKGMMKELSGYGVNLIMPRLLKDLHQMNWKSKVANIEILGQFAFCAPKQLTFFIPKVIKEIMQVLKDPHVKVQETAVSVLKDIASAIKNPEIVDVSSILIEAISNPYENSQNALSALLETEFKHYLDPPSIALIIPIIDYNLKIQNDTLKRQASHIIGSLQNIISNTNDLVQYKDIIVPDLKGALFDSNPDCRNTIAKSIGALTKSLGAEYLEDMIKFLVSFLEKESETVQRSGAAQAYAEILVSFGDAYIDKHLMHLISKIQEGDHVVKEGYLSIFVFLPGCLGDKFEKYFELIFPLIIEAFSDDHENVRNVSNKIFEICIKLYAKKNTKELIDPLLIRLFDPNWRIRNSSIALIKTLIMNLNNEFFKESSDYFQKEQRDQILTMTFILKSDVCGNTSTIANMIWRDYVDNIPKYLSKILKNIYEQLMNLLSYQTDETFEIAEASVKLLSSKFSDKFFMELLPVIRETIIQQKENESIVNTSFYILYIAVSEISEKLLSAFKDKILKIVNENLFTPFSSVRKQIAKIVYEISRKLNEHNLNRNLIFNVMKQARGKPTEEQKKILEIVACLVEISKGEIINYAISEIFRKPYEEGFLDLGSMISESIAIYYGEAVEIKNLYSNLTDAFYKFPQHAANTIVAITEKIDDDSLPLFVEFLTTLQGKLEQKSAESKGKPPKETLEYFFSDIISNFCSITQQNLIPDMEAFVEITTHLLYFDNNEITMNVGSILKNLVEKTEKSPDVDIVIKSFLASLETLNKKFAREKSDEEITEVLTNKFKLMMDNLLFTIQNGLLFGEDKLLACNLVNEVINHSSRQNLKPYIMKMVGPIIRILSEKIPPQIKEKLMDNAKALITKSKEDIKGISPQLQSVFIKALTDSTVQSCERFQIKAGENIIRLLQYYPRADVTANDILKSIQNKIDIRLGINAIFEMEILSDVIRFYGQNLKPNTITQQFNTIKMLLETHQEIPFDGIIVLLSSYTQYLPNDIKEGITFSNELHEKLYNFISVFNGDSKVLEEKKKSIISIIKPLKKDQAIILLKPLGKIINKYRCYKEFNEKKYEEILDQYENVIKEIFNECDLTNATAELPDANLCLILLSLGYMKIYDTDKALLKKIFHFIIELMDLGKINLQLLVSCLSLLVLKEIKQTPNRDEVMAEIGEITSDEKEINIVDSFLKKIYYLYDK